MKVPFVIYICLLLQKHLGLCTYIAGESSDWLFRQPKLKESDMQVCICLLALIFSPMGRIMVDLCVIIENA